MVKRINKYKKGYVNIILSIAIILIAIILVTSFFVYYQVIVILHGIKQDLFYIAQNAIIAYEKESLIFSEYDIKNNKLKQIIEEVLYKNYVRENSQIKEIKIEELYVITNKINDQKYESSEIYVKVNIEFKPIVSFKTGQTYTVPLEDKIKISLMQYNMKERET